MKSTESTVVIIRDERYRARALEVINALKIGEKPWQMTIEPYKSKRSLAQNALLHVWMRYVSAMYHESAGQLYSPAAWKIYFKRMFLGEETFMVREQAWTETRHTADLDVLEFSALLNSIDFYCGSELHIALPHPEYLWNEAMG
jgi:hypothetical protein